jgi:hypothetical protein
VLSGFFYAQRTNIRIVCVEALLPILPNDVCTLR